MLKSNWAYYSVYRVILGLYLFIHFLGLCGYCEELFSNYGMLADIALSPNAWLYPSILLLDDSPGTVMALVILALLASVSLIIGKYDRIAGVIIWYVLTCLLDRNPLIEDPSLAYIGWLLLAHAAIKPAQKGQIDWQMPSGIFFAAWCVMSVGYTYSGLAKLTSPSWLDGSALTHVLHMPFSRRGFMCDLLLALPPEVQHLLTWLVVGIEVLFMPLALFKVFRPWIWTLMLLMHVSVLFVITFAELTFAMILLHLFTFDLRWLEADQHLIALHKQNRHQNLTTGRCQSG